MPTLQISLNKPDERIDLIHDLSSQMMRLRQVVVEWGIQTDAAGLPVLPIPPETSARGALLDLTDMGASTSEILGYSPYAGSTSFLHIPRPSTAYYDASAVNVMRVMNNVETFYIMSPNLSFHSGDISRAFSIRTYCDNSVMIAQPYSPTELRSITLYFDYETNDVNR
jgi:hypothetical protein